MNEVMTWPVVSEAERELISAEMLAGLRARTWLSTPTWTPAGGARGAIERGEAAMPPRRPR